MLLTRRWPTSGLVGLFGLPLLLAACVVYYAAFAADLRAYTMDRGLLQYALNSHDHLIYVMRVGPLRDVLYPLELSNNIGIALLYSMLVTALPFLANTDYTLVALVFNCAVLIAIYVVWAGLCNDLGLGTVAKLAFFANLSLLYFAQLINKDMLTILAFLVTARLGLHGKLFWILALIPVFVLVRLQLGLFAVLCVILLRSERPVAMIAALYVVTSLVGGWLSVYVPIIGDDTLGSGFSRFLIGFNREYYVGYLLFNPLRLAQYALDLLLSFWVLTPSGGLEVARLLRIPQILLLFALGGSLATMVTHFTSQMRSPRRALVMVTVAYLLTWLMNPTVNARYVMLITPVLVLFALHARGQRRVEAIA